MKSGSGQPDPPLVSETVFRGRIGFAQRDITPPTGIYSRLWGAASHDTAEGVHRPILLQVMVLAERSGDMAPFVFVTFDTCLIRHSEYTMFEAAVERASGIDDSSRIILQATHTHSSCPLSPENKDQPGGALIDAHLENICREIESGVSEALAGLDEADLSWRYGSCGLAANRDLPDPGTPEGHYACGYNPTTEADSTLCVGRVTSLADGRILGILGHYACHPTTLAWENRLLSPDWLGAARETVTAHCQGAPFLLLQGTSGDQAPRRQYTGDTAVADANGREVAYAVLSVLEGMLPAGARYRYERTLKSGADLGVWQCESFDPPAQLQAVRSFVDLPLKPYECEGRLEEQLAVARRDHDEAAAERLRRQILRVRSLGGADHYPSPLTIWKVGNSFWIAQPEEAYACFQQCLREEFPGRVLLPLNLAAGPTLSYLYPEKYAQDYRYPVWVSTFRPEAYTLLEEETLSLLKNSCNET